MSTNVKMLRGNLKVVIAYPEAFANPATPTSTELNNLFVYGTKEDAMVFDISCAIVDDGYTFNLTDVDADIADGIPFLQAIGILEFRMDDEAGLTKDFGMSQGQDDKGK